MNSFVKKLNSEYSKTFSNARLHNLSFSCKHLRELNGQRMFKDDLWEYIWKITPKYTKIYLNNLENHRESQTATYTCS